MQPQARMTGEDRRRQLIEVAIDLFSQRGFAGTTTKEIAAAAGVTEAMIFRHFATKQDFYKAILDYKCGGDGPEKWMAETKTFMDRNDDEGLFRFLISKILQFYREEPQFERLLIHAALEGHELAIMHHNQMASSIGAHFKNYIARRQSEGALRQCEPSAVLFSLAGIAQFYALQKYIHQRSELTMPDEQMVDSFLLILMGGLRVSKNGGKSHEGKTR
ncbi:MAG: TetR/AcrR family transcriptional regulator [Bryobacterales bacterium]|jgi:TetR/AcrR family transcriptional regulator|nr:TetR/AcrR family transcriptional regulator [Bryobacterales bacterium]